MPTTFINLWLVSGTVEDRPFADERAALADIYENRGERVRLDPTAPRYAGTALVDERGWRGITDRSDDAVAEMEWRDRETAREARYIGLRRAV